MVDLPAASERSFDRLICVVRGHKVFLDSTLAQLYGVPIKAFLQAVRRNLARFPDDFMFQLDPAETDRLRSQDVTLKKGRGRHRKYLPYAFTEQGVAMLSSVLRSERAILVNIAIMRTFVRLRLAALDHQTLAERLDELESRVAGHDASIADIFEAIRELMEPPEQPPRKIGY